MLIKTVSHFFGFNLGVEMSSKKKDLPKKREGGESFGRSCAWEGSNDLPWEGKALPGASGVEKNYID